MKKTIIAFLAITMCAFAAGNRRVWDFTKPQPDWNKTKKLTATRESQGLRLNINGYDSSITASVNKLSTKSFGRLRIIYKADKLPDGPTSGEFFFSDTNNLKDKAFFRIPALIGDGKWHSLDLTTESDIPYGSEQWYNMDNITTVRLDILNQFPANIVLKSIEFLKPLCQEIHSINDVNIKDGWLLHRTFFRGTPNANASFKAGSYKVWARGTDSMEIAEYLNKMKVSGENFAPAQSKTFINNWIYLGILNSTGKNVTFTLPASPNEDFSALLITTDTAVPEDKNHKIPQSVEVDLPEKAAVPIDMVFDKNKPYWRGHMTWVRGFQDAIGSSFVRREFTIEELPKEALLQTTADDAIRNVWINGKLLENTQWTESWKDSSNAVVTPYIQKGKNVLCIEYHNGGNVGGLLFDLALTDNKGAVDFVTSDSSCTGVFKNPPKGWNELGFTGKLSPVDTALPPPNSPWTTAVDYIPRFTPKGTYTVKSLHVPKTVSVIKDFNVSLSFIANPPVTANEIGYARILNENNTELAIISEKLSDLNLTAEADGTRKITFKNFALPEFGPAFTAKVECGIHYRTLNNQDKTISPTISFSERKADTGPEPLKNAKVVNSGNGNRLLVNDKPFYPFFLSVFYEKAPTGLEGEGSPVNIREFPCGGTANNWWLDMGKYDFSQIDYRMNKAMKEFPNAYIALWIWCMPPTWYSRLYPDRISRNFDGSKFDYYTATVTFSDRDFQADMDEALNQLVGYCEKYYGKRIIAYNLCGGVSFEWQGWGCHGLAAKKTLADYSPASQRDFKDFLAKYYPEIKVNSIPTYNQRFSSDDTIFRNPLKDAASIAYDDYYADAIAGCITRFAKTVKNISNYNKLVGCYYGYLFEYGNMGYCINSSGHNAVAKVLDSPDIDFLLSPPSYGIRAIGNSGGDMKPFGSIALHRKFSILEDDTRTNASVFQGYNQTLTDWQTQMVLRRNWGMALSRKTPVCHLPIVDSRDFSKPQTRKDLIQVVKVGQMLFDKDAKYHADVAFVIDETSSKYLEPVSQYNTYKKRFNSAYSLNGMYGRPFRSSQLLTGELTYYQRIAMSQFGGAGDWILLSDVEKYAQNYKMIVFLNVYKNSDLAKKAMAAAKKHASAVVVTYGMGFLGDKGIDAGLMSELTGINVKRTAAGPLSLVINDMTALPGSVARETAFGEESSINPRFSVIDKDARIIGRYADNNEAAIAVKRLGNANVYFHGANSLTPDILAGIAADAGVHLYTQPGDTLFAGSGIITIHTASAGDKTVTLPQAMDAVDIYSLEVVAKKTTSFTFHMPAHSTRTFALGNAEEILKLLK